MTRRRRRIRIRLAFRALALASAVASLLTPARAVTLGEIAIDSALGQPLSARVPVQLYAGETMGAGCVSVPSAGRPELGQVPNPIVIAPESAAAGLYELRISTRQALYEPMYELQIQVRCPGTPLLVRQYVLMLDLPGATPPLTATVTNAAATPAPAPADRPRATAPAPGPDRPPPQRARAAESIAAGSRYRVSANDTLFGIAARVTNRNGRSVRATADDILAANPEAFIRGNRDLIKLGSEIIIPAGAAELPAVVTPQAMPEPVPPLTTPASAETAPAEADSGAVADVAAPPAQAAGADAPAAAETGSGALTPDAVAAPRQTQPEAPTPLARARPAAAEGGSGESTPAWLGALAGILAGLVASALLLRERLTGLLRKFAMRRQPAAEPDDDFFEEAAATAVAPRFHTRQTDPESTMIVEETIAQRVEDFLPFGQGDSEAFSPTGEDSASATVDLPVDDDLSRLFADEVAQQDAPENDLENADVPLKLDLDLTAATAYSAIDEDIGSAGEDPATAHTNEMPRPAPPGDTVEQMDLQTMAQRAMDEDALSQTLQEALNLLESDYEEELTASQLIDRRKFQDAAADDSAADELARTGTDQFPRRR